MSNDAPILVTGAAGRIGGVGGEIVNILRRRNLPVRALVRTDDDRAQALRAIGAEVAVGDLTRVEDVARALNGCRRMYFGMSVSASYLEAAATVAAVARGRGDLEVLVNISQLTVSQMSLTAMTDSHQQRQHWLGEQVLNWSGLPVIHVRATVFLQHPFFSTWAAESIARDDTIRLPFGNGRTSPVDTQDVAAVIAAILERPAVHVGNVYELTGPRSEDMPAVAMEFTEALGRTITYVDEPFDRWQRELIGRNLPEHLGGHLLVMAKLHADNQYDRLTHDVEAVIGRPATSIRAYVQKHPEIFSSGKAALAVGSR
jgi:NAD(P)H dehydrogenase (quinone)